MMFRYLISLLFLAGIAAQVTNFDVPDNDRCIQRERLEPFVPITGDLTNANFDYYNQGVCGPRSDRVGLWYEVRGRGDFVTVHVCTNNDIITDFGVFQKCNTQLCEGAPGQTFEPASCDLNQTKEFRFNARNNVQYFVHVRSDIINGVGSNFTIVYEDESLDGPIDETEVPPGTPGSSTNGVQVGDGCSRPTIFGMVVMTFAAGAISILL